MAIINSSQYDDAVARHQPEPSATPDHLEVNRFKRVRLSPSEPSRCGTPASRVPFPATGSSRDLLHDVSPTLLPRLATNRTQELVTKSSPRIAQDESDAPQICFGTISGLLVKAIDGQIEIPPTASVDVLSGRVSLHGSGRTVGRLEDRAAKTLEELSTIEGLELHAFIQYTLLVACIGSSAANRPRSRPTVFVTLYGRRQCHDSLGFFLDQRRLFLQDPVRCDRNVEYHNPHRLTDPADRVRMTFEFHTAQTHDLDEFDSPEDVLASLEHSGSLEQSHTPPTLRTELFPHQKQALTFMRRREAGWALRPFQNDLDIWTACKEDDGHNLDGSAYRQHPPTLLYRNNVTDETTYKQPAEVRGGILGDTMGLGKSLTAIALIASDKVDQRSCVLHDSTGPDVGATLLVVKPPLLETWRKQFRIHVKSGLLAIQLHHGNSKLNSVASIAAADVVLTTYQTLMEEWKKRSASKTSIYSVRWHRIILDEAHEIRDHKSATCQAMCALDATRRWAVTGTPIQNRLLDLASLFKFLRLYPYDDTAAFQALTNQLVELFQQDGARLRLRKMVKCVMLRRSLASVPLPARFDKVCRLDFSEGEAELYRRLQQQGPSHQTKSIEADDEGAPALQLFARLRKVCNLGVLGQNEIVHEGPAASCDWDQYTAQQLFQTRVVSGTAACKSCCIDCSVATTQTIEESSGEEFAALMFPCGHILCRGCILGVQRCDCATLPGRAFPVSLICDTTPHDSWTSPGIPGISTKVSAVLADLQAHISEEKCIVFSFWTSTLDVIAQGLRDRGIAYVRYDGTVPPKRRIEDLAAFSSESSIRVALLTISCGAVGLDLTAASRAYLMEPQWNPSVEQQALARIHRIGQMRPVTTIRYIMRNTLEEYILTVQHRKQALASALISSSDATSGASSSDFLKAIM